MNFYVGIPFLEMQSARPYKTGGRLCNSFRVPQDKQNKKQKTHRHRQ